MSNYSHSGLFYWYEILYNSELIEKNMSILDFVISIGIVCDIEVIRHMHCVILLFFEKWFCNFIVSK